MTCQRSGEGHGPSVPSAPRFLRPCFCASVLADKIASNINSVGILREKATLSRISCLSLRKVAGGEAAIASHAIYNNYISCMKSARVSLHQLYFKTVRSRLVAR